jgi:hypothetical protein
MIKLNDLLNEMECWDGYKKGNPKTKISPKTGERVNNCVPIKEEQSEEYPPYMFSSVGFGCHVCKYLNFNKDEDKYTCGNTNYQEYIGTHFIVDPETKEPVSKENLKNYCSNWFEPK